MVVRKAPGSFGKNFVQVHFRLYPAIKAENSFKLSDF